MDQLDEVNGDARDEMERRAVIRRCLACHRPFPGNDVVEHFPASRRIAYDPERGRLWAICDGCGRWTLAPIETRWEALEELAWRRRAAHRSLTCGVAHPPTYAGWLRLPAANAAANAAVRPRLPAAHAAANAAVRPRLPAAHAASDRDAGGALIAASRPGTRPTVRSVPPAAAVPRSSTSIEREAPHG